MALASIMVLRFVIAVALAVVLITPPAAAQSGVKTRPVDLNAYSLRFWPRNALLRGQTVRAQTPYGVLTCISIGPATMNCTGSPRSNSAASISSTTPLRRVTCPRNNTRSG